MERSGPGVETIRASWEMEPIPAVMFRSRQAHLQALMPLQQAKYIPWHKKLTVLVGPGETMAMVNLETEPPPNSNVPGQVSGLCPLLSVNEITVQVPVSVFPNPCNGHFTLILSGEIKTVEIYNMLGEIVYHAEMIRQQSEIDLSNQPKGIYIAKFYSGQNIQSEKIMIQ